jgi:hypothetical protein
MSLWLCLTGQLKVCLVCQCLLYYQTTALSQSNQTLSTVHICSSSKLVGIYHNDTQYCKYSKFYTAIKAELLLQTHIA